MQKKSFNTLSMAALMALGITTSTWACNAAHVLGVGSASSAYTVSANTMKKGSFFLGINTEKVQNITLADATIIKAMENGATHLHNIDTIDSHALSLSYGINDKLSINLQLPYITRTNIRAGEEDAGSFEVHPHQDAAGMGDLSALLQYKVYDKTFKVAILGGVKAPTGKKDIVEAGETLEADLQPGSGSWDLFAGSAFTKDYDTFSVHSNILYKYNTKGVAESQLGDILTYNVALSYNLTKKKPHEIICLVDDHKEVKHDSEYSVAAFVELNGENAEEDSFEGVTAKNTGHNVIFATIGMQVATHSNYAFFFAISKPIHQKFNGLQNEIDYRASMGIGKSF